MSCKDCPDKINAHEVNINTTQPQQQEEIITQQCPSGHKLFSVVLNTLDKCALYYTCVKPEKKTADYCISGFCPDVTNMVEVQATCPICHKNFSVIFNGKSIDFKPLEGSNIFIKSVQINGININVTLGTIE